MRAKYHGLKKVKIRQSWSKYNLYNLSRLRTPTAVEKTFFQQKWAAKSLTRAYHGEQVREGKWELMFSRDLPAVVSMDARTLAHNDGSEWSLGRGGGLDNSVASKRKKPEAETPYMHMTYGPLERRLDTAVWRALFASSARQARQFVVHGFVKVNGKRMVHPGYLLNPGDMFSVDPERVLFATGARKDQPWDGREFERLLLRQRDGVIESRSPATEEVDDQEEEDEHDEYEEDIEGLDESVEGTDSQKELKDRLKLVRADLQDFQEKKKKNKAISAKHKQELRALLKEIKRTMSKIRSATTDSVGAIESAAAAITNTAQLVFDAQSGVENPEDATKKPQNVLTDTTVEATRGGISDDSKPYRTPWRPRDYMSAFAFIPRYLEVNQMICSAVYLRHPVARPGLAEVPTPVSQETSQLAFNWYLRRR